MREFSRETLFGAVTRRPVSSRPGVETAAAPVPMFRCREILDASSWPSASFMMKVFMIE
jgi:hypothetical protein